MMTRETRTSSSQLIHIACFIAVSFGAYAMGAEQQSGPVTNNFRTKPGLKVELVVSEPQVLSPVAMAFDEEARLFVAERPPDNPQRGRIRLLEDPERQG